MQALGKCSTNIHSSGMAPTGFAKRYATAYADQVIGNYMNEAIFPTLFRQDPRYYRISH
jgi:hypothetical protein